MADNNNRRIVQVNAVGRTLSTGRTTWEMHEYFTEHGLESYIATSRGNECPESYPISTLTGVRADHALSLLTGFDGCYSKIQTKKFLRYLDTVRPDIMHLRNLHEYYIDLGMLLRYLAKKNIATVVTMHDSWFMTGKCCLHKIEKCDKWQTGCGDCPVLKRDGRLPMFDRTAKMWTDKKKHFEAIPRLAVVGNSRWTMEETKKSYLRCADIMDFVYNWIDFSVFHPYPTDDLRKKMRLEGKKVILGVSTSWTASAGKGLITYLELAKRMPENYRILLIGRLSQECDLPDKLTILPFTNNTSELARYYSLADVYLNLSESETFGKVSAEAVSCGTPLIARNTTANPEIVPKGAGCILTECAVEEILSALEIVFSKPKETYSEACLAHAHSSFDKDTNIKRYLKIYDTLLEET